MKTCVACGVEKQDTEFAGIEHNTGGETICVECHREVLTDPDAECDACKPRTHWMSAAMECFGVDSQTPCTAQALREHCEGCGFDVPEGLRDDLAGRVICDAPSMVGWTGYAPRIAGDRWILAE